MAALFLDHNVSLHLVSLLHRRGHDVVTTRDLGLGGADDDIILTTATDQGRVLVTGDRTDFIPLHRVWTRWSRRWGVAARHGGILILPPPSDLPIPEAARVLNERLAGSGVAGELFEYHKPPASRWEQVVFL